MRLLSLVCLGALLLNACMDRQSSPPAQKALERGTGGFTTYATGFKVEKQRTYTSIQVTDPWQQSKNVIFTYILAPDRGQIPDSIEYSACIQTPVRRAIVLSTTHLAMIEELGGTESIVGLSGSDYIYSPVLRERVKSGQVQDVGYGQGLDFETIVRLEPDVVFLYGVEGNVMTTIEKLRDLGIPAVFCGEYLETHPLGKAEWIKFFSLFYGKEALSFEYFRGIDSSYNKLAALASDVESKPLVLSGLPWKDTWYMAGGRSFAARLIEDAGGNYLWGENNSTEAVPLDLETVYLRAVKADFWINPGSANSLKDIVLLDKRLESLAVLKEGRVFNNNARISPGGGNDYWESGTISPDLILADLIATFHPGLLPDHRFVYYRQLK